MANNAENVIVQQDTVLFVAPVGEAMPADVTAEPAGKWRQVGYLNPDGVTLTINQEKQDIEALQSLNPIKTIVTKTETKLSLGLMEFTGENFGLAFPGVRKGSSSKFTWEFDKSAGTERAYILQIKEGTKVFRVLIPKASSAGEVSMSITKLDAIALPIELSLQDTGKGPFSIQTNIATWAPA